MQMIEPEGHSGLPGAGAAPNPVAPSGSDEADDDNGGWGNNDSFNQQQQHSSESTTIDAEQPGGNRQSGDDLQETMHPLASTSDPVIASSDMVAETFTTKRFTPRSHRSSRQRGHGRNSGDRRRQHGSSDDQEYEWNKELEETRLRVEKESAERQFEERRRKLAEDNLSAQLETNHRTQETYRLNEERLRHTIDSHENQIRKFATREQEADERLRKERALWQKQYDDMKAEAERAKKERTEMEATLKQSQQRWQSTRGQQPPAQAETGWPNSGIVRNPQRQDSRVFDFDVNAPPFRQGKQAHFDNSKIPVAVPSAVPPLMGGQHSASATPPQAAPPPANPQAPPPQVTTPAIVAPPASRSTTVVPPAPPVFKAPTSSATSSSAVLSTKTVLSTAGSLTVPQSAAGASTLLLPPNDVVSGLRVKVADKGNRAATYFGSQTTSAAAPTHQQGVRPAEAADFAHLRIPRDNYGGDFLMKSTIYNTRTTISSKTTWFKRSS